MSESKTTSDPRLQSLHSTYLSDGEYRLYEPEFRFAFSDPEIRNIAVSGAYGAGKSTVVDTWERRVREEGDSNNKAWVHVSLAKFSDEAERDVESELINQLVHKVTVNGSPKSRFRVTRDAPVWWDVIKAAYVLALIVLTVGMFAIWTNPEAWTGVVEVPQVAETVVWLVLVILLFTVCFRRRSVSRALKRVKVSNAEIELYDHSEGTDAGAFDRYLDDIVYLLASSKVDVVVFEDLDRFDDVSIFEKLRRVNELANARRDDGRGKCKCGDKSGTLRFLYLVRDSLFDDPQDRTKFFDLIIPVIPFVDPNNSFDVLSRGLASAGIEVSEPFLYQLSIFIDDPRVLKDICNESYHFKRVLCSSKGRGEQEKAYWSDEKLVAMMAYKALFPADYESLQVRRGYVFSLFERREELVEEIRASKESRIETLQAELQEIEQRNQLNEKELKLAYAVLSKDFRRNITNEYPFNNNTYGSPQKLLSDITSNQNMRREIDKALTVQDDARKEYETRLQEVRGDASARSKAIEAEIRSLQEDILDLSRMSVSDLLNIGVADTDEFFCPAEENQQVLEDEYFPILRFLVTQGFIDETYQLYMSNRYNGALSLADESFVFSLLGGRVTDSVQDLDNPSGVILRLSGAMLARSTARNVSLFNELLLQGPEEKREAFLRGIGRDHDSGFVCRYLLSGHVAANAFVELGSHYESCMADALSNPNVSEGDKRAFCHTLFGEPGAHLLISALGEAAGEFASSDPHFLDLEAGYSREKVPGFENNLKAVGYRVGAISFDSADSVLLAYVADEGLFVPTEHNVLGLVRLLSGDSSIEPNSLNNKLVSEEGSAFDELRSHVAEGMETYLESLLSDKAEDFRLDDGDAAVEMILNALGPESAELARGYIRLLRSRVADLGIIESPEFRTVILDERKCENTRENVCAYLEVPGFDESLAGFLSSEGVPDGLNAEYLETREIDSAAFLRSCVLSRDLDEDALACVASHFGQQIDSFNFAGADEKRVKTVIEAGIFPVTVDILADVRKAFPDLAAALAETDLEAYVGLVLPAEESACAFSDMEAVKLFGIDGLDVGQLARLTAGLAQLVPLSADYPDEVNLGLLENGKFDGDAASLASVFEQADEELRGALAEYAAKHYKDLAGIKMCEELELAVASRLSNDPNAAKTFIAGRAELGGDVSVSARAYVRKLVGAAGLDDYVRLLDGSDVSLAVSPADERLITALQEKGLCGKLEAQIHQNGKRVVHAKRFRQL